MSKGRKHISIPVDMTTPVPVWCVGTYDEQDRPNVMTASWAGIVCSRPPCVAVALRDATHSCRGLQARKAFTVSVPSETQYVQADYFGMAGGKTKDKFAASRTTAVRSDKVDAPYVAEFPLILECELKESVVLGLHTLYVGEIMGVKAHPDILNGDTVDASKLAPFFFSPSERAYYRIGERLSPAFAPGRALMDR
ncbi:MAG TPA: flavin reductase family protein [Kiritimatiellia bacterium]|nr:flavin reductase family protein [Kiritimatiellia bacterium]HNS80810.1 flavin reductase family protein [Kiritimatiellia bacterium]